MENKNIERLQKPYNFEYDEILGKIFYIIYYKSGIT